MAETPEQRELNLVGKVELRVALAETDAKLETNLRTYLAPLLLKLASESKRVRDKVISICQHINTRIKPPSIQLPVDALLKQFKTTTNPLVRHFDLLYVQQGVDRLPISDRLKLLPTLIVGLSANYQESPTHAATLFHQLLKLLHNLQLPARGSKEDIGLRETLNLSHNKQDSEFIATWLGKLILFDAPPRKTGKRHSALDVQECEFLQVFGKEDTWRASAGGLNLVATKVVAAKFLASGGFEDTERFLPALFASADSNSRVSDVGDDILKRAASIASLEDDRLIESLLTIYLGKRGVEGSLPARAGLQMKILMLLCKSKTSSSFVAKSIQLIQEGLTPATDADGPIRQGLEASKHRGHIFAYVNWLARTSSSADVENFAPILVGQLRGYIETQGWPRYEMDGINSNELSSRRYGYETIGLLAASCPNQLLFDIDLELLRWLLYSLAGDSSGKETSISIEQALSSVMNAFTTSLATEIATSLTELLLDYVGLRMGDVLQGTKETVVRSTRYVAVRFANRCLPFSNTGGRLIDILALEGGESERNEVLEEGSKGLEPYWHAKLNAHNSYRPPISSGSSTQQAPDFSALVFRFYDPGGYRKDTLGNVRTFSTRAADAAALFCHSILFHQALRSEQLEPPFDEDWERKLSALVANDAKARRAVKSYIKGMGNDSSTLAEAFDCFLRVLFLAMAPESEISASRSADALLALLSMAPDKAISSFASEASNLTAAVYSNDKFVRISASNVFGILASHGHAPSTSIQGVLGDFERKYTSWHSAVGSETLKVHGAILATAFWASRSYYRARPWPEFEERWQRLLQICFDIISKSRDNLLLEAATSTIAELSAFAVISVKSFSSPKASSSALHNLKEAGQKGDERATMALGFLGMQCAVKRDINAQNVPTATTTFNDVVEILYSLHEVRQAEVQFAVGAALSCASVGWASDYMIGKLDVEGPSLNERLGAIAATSSQPGQSLSTDGNERLKLVLDRVLRDCKTTKPALRQASVIWLLCLVQYCAQLEAIQSVLRECQKAFAGFLADHDSLNRETAARGISLVYQKGDRAIKNDLVRELVASFTGNNAGLAGQVSEQTELFEPGALPTGENQSITTYGDIMKLAAEVGDPSLVYRFMSMASNNAIWTSRAAFGQFGLSNVLSDSSVDGYLAQNPKLYPALFRFRFDPNSNVRSSMNDIWRTIVKEPAVVIDQFFDNIMDDLLKNIVGREWRVRQACCAAIADLVQGKVFEKYEKYLDQIWTMTYKVCDDIKGSVREAAQSLARILAGILTRSLEAGSSPSGKVDSMLKTVLQFLFSTSGLESTSKEIQVFSLSTLLDIVKSSNFKTIRPYVPDIIGQLVALLSSFEHEGINYLHLNAEKYGVTTQQIDDARLSGVKGSPIMEAIERCLDALDGHTMDKLQDSLDSAIKTAVGLPSKVGSSRILVSLSTRHNFIFKSHADHFLKLIRKQLHDRNDTVASAYATACGYLARLASDAEILDLVQYCQKNYFQSDDERHRIASGDVVYAVSKHATDRFNSLAGAILPFIFIAQQDPLQRAATSFKQAWEENVGGSRTVLLYIKDIAGLAMEYLDSPRWSVKHTSAFAIAESVSSMGDEISALDAGTLWPALDKAISGKTWDGKERVLRALVKFAKISKTLHSNEKAQMQKIMIRESKRNNAVYRQEALACLGDFVEIRDDTDLFDQVLEVTQPVIIDTLDDSSEMDVDSTSGGLSTKSITELTLAHALSSLLRSINPKCRTDQDLNLALRQTLELVQKATSENGSIIVRDEIYSAEKVLFDKMSDVELTDGLDSILIEYARSLSSAGNQVEQSRMKAAEVGLALGPLGRTGGGIKKELVEQLSQLRAQERSVPVQQCLERAMKSLDS